MTPVIEVTGLTKRYGGQAVVDGISFHVERGEIFGILGPNGAGKTTAVECMEGLRRRDAGQVRILGLDPKTDGHRLHQRLGVQLQETQLQDKIEVREALGLYASFYPDPADWRTMRQIGNFTPLGSALHAVRDSWMGMDPRPEYLGIMAAWALVAGALAARFFRWDQA
jgi:ABC-type multidrug transport system ATPase subunit